MRHLLSNYHKKGIKSIYLANQHRKLGIIVNTHSYICDVSVTLITQHGKITLPILSMFKCKYQTPKCPANISHAKNHSQCAYVRAVQSYLTYLAKSQSSSKDDPPSSPSLQQEEVGQESSAGDDPSLISELPESNQEENRGSGGGVEEEGSTQPASSLTSSESKDSESVSEEELSEAATPRCSEREQTSGEVTEAWGCPAPDSRTLSTQSEAGEVDESGAEKGKAGHNPAEENISRSAGFLWLTFNSEEDRHHHRNSGGQAEPVEIKITNTQTKLKQLLKKFLSDVEELFESEEGADFWDKRKIIKSITSSPQTLPHAKYSKRKADSRWLFVDVSASVSDLAEFMMTIITAAGDDFNIVIGSEAHPQQWIDFKDYLRVGNWWVCKTHHKTDYVHEFTEQLKNFIKTNKIAPGSLLIFWSDYIDIHINDMQKLKKLLQGYKVVWLNARPHNYNNEYYGYEAWKVKHHASMTGNIYIDNINPANFLNSLRRWK